MSRLVIILQIVLICLGLSVAVPSAAQIQFHSTTPNVDSFPVVRTRISIMLDSEDPDKIQKTHLTVMEDGVKIPNFELQNCDVADRASIALLIDISTSMQFTLHHKSERFVHLGLSQFLQYIPAPSEIAVVPFNDTVAEILPASYRPANFYSAEVETDTAELMQRVRALQFAGNTDVDYAMWIAAEHLKLGVHQRKAIVLITDDGLSDRGLLTQRLIDQGISLYILDLSGDSLPGNLAVAKETGGVLYSPRDSTEIPYYMDQIARAIYTKKCELRYVSTHPCPWHSEKILWLGLNYRQLNRTQLHQFSVGGNRTERAAPRIVEAIVSETSRKIGAIEDFPCESGIASFADSASVNFARLVRYRDLPNDAYDSIVVVDEANPASGWYVVRDSAGNVAKFYVSYSPPPDTNAPQWGIPVLNGAQYIVSVSEVRKWDRGLGSIGLSSGSANLTLDSVTFFNPKLAQAYVSMVDAGLPASGCLIAIDSAGNDSSACISWAAAPGDQRPPIIVQRPTPSPIASMHATVEEKQALDRGILSVSVSSRVNAGAASISYSSQYEAAMELSIVDSLFDASATINAVDSSGNRSSYILQYFTQPDTNDPTLVPSSIDDATVKVEIAEAKAWDRGIRAVNISNISNATVSSPLFKDVRHASLLVTRIDPYVDGMASIEAFDSAGNSFDLRVVIASDRRPDPLPLIVRGPIDFGSIVAPAVIKRSVWILNPNAQEVDLIAGSISGDDSVFSFTTPFAITIPSMDSLLFEFAFEPVLLGNWDGQYTFEVEGLPPAIVALSGESIGILDISASDTTVEMAGRSGVLRVKIDGSPRIMNLDTLSFQLQVDPDIVVLKDPSGDVAQAKGLSNYQFVWSEVSQGLYQVDLSRLSDLQSLELIELVSILVPFDTYLGPATTSPVRIVNPVGSLVSVATEDGRITIAGACGDELIRNAFDGQPLILKSLNVGVSAVALAVESSSSATANVSLVDAIGIEHFHRPAELTSGLNPIELGVAQLPSGVYFLTIRTDRATILRKIEIIR